MSLNSIIVSNKAPELYSFQSNRKKCWLLLMVKIVMLQFLFVGWFYESKLIYNHQGRKVNLWEQISHSSPYFIVLLVIAFSDIKVVILVLLKLFLD